MKTIHIFNGQRTSRFSVVVASLIFCWACSNSVDLPQDVAAVENQLPDEVDYNLHVKPILSDRCFACHGPDKTKQKAGLRLDLGDQAFAFASKETGRHAIVPGEPGSSEMVHRILAKDPDVVMPTPESHLTLTAEEKAILVKWIDQGAKYKPHWAFVPPSKPSVPTVKNESWVRNDIDRFVLKKLEDKGLTPAKEADKITLLRRVSLDLTGLPPTIAETDAFLADHSPNAYEKVVNRLLRSTHFGEQQATGWLDAARYADSNGYQDDALRTMWPYRDWVIRAFNQNLPYDKFVTWQVAGDLLPNPSRDMKVATAFNRNHSQSQEDGIVAAEYQTEYVIDRVNTFGKAMLGLTVECARCHDHKYDPISQKDFYGLYAFFNTNNEYGQIPYNGEPSPHLTLPTPQADATLRFIRTQLKTQTSQKQQDLPKAQNRFKTWLASVEKAPAPQLVPADQDLRISISFEKMMQKTVSPTDKPAKSGVSTKKEVAKPRTDYFFVNRANDTLPMTVRGDLEHLPVETPGRFGKAVLLSGGSFLELKGPTVFSSTFSNPGPISAWFDRYEAFTAALWVNIQNPALEGPLFNRNMGVMAGFRGYQCVRLADGRLAFRLSYVWPDDAIDIETTQKIPLNRWTHLAITYDGSSRASGVQIYINGQLTPVRTVTDNLTQSIVWGKNKTFQSSIAYNFAMGQLHNQNMKGYAIDELNVYGRKLTPLEINSLVLSQDAVLAILKTPGNRRTASQQRALYDYYLTNIDPIDRLHRATQRDLIAQETDIMNRQVDVMVMRDRRFPPATHLLKRGAYDAPGEVITPNTLSSLNPPPSVKNRLGLAQWLLSAENPVFARVVVNRFWQQFFGKGLVKTSDDFGNQGELPSHPELLDYLAVSFRDTYHWNMKAMIRQIVLSATYRQSSQPSPKLLELDPDNRLLARGPSFRLSAEQVRDNALAASGLLNQKIGGPSVYPYQPAGIWEALATRNAVHYVQSHGDSLYRRSLYTVWKRSSPPPMMINFDAPERYTCTVNRQKTSTPLQSLVTLNDPQFIEAARVLAQHALEKRLSPDQLIAYAFRLVVSRLPRTDEIALMQQLYRDERNLFAKQPQEANALLSVGEYPTNAKLSPVELASWTTVMSTIMNFDEAIIKR